MITLADYVATLLVGFVFLGGIYWLGPRLYEDLVSPESHWIPEKVNVPSRKTNSQDKSNN